MSDTQHAYEGMASSWAAGPSRLYDHLASIFVDAIVADLAGAAVLDVGAGTGAVCRALRRRGATPYALDTSPDMLAHAGRDAALAIVGDMCALPFPDGSFDAAVSAFAISHVGAPATALAEMGRVTRPGGVVAAVVFGAQAGGAKDAVDDVATQFGYRHPSWYARLKDEFEPLSNSPDLLETIAADAALLDVAVHDRIVESGLDSPAQVVEYRLGMAHMAPFVDGLSPTQRTTLVRQAEAAVARSGQSVRPRLLILSSRAPA